MYFHKTPRWLMWLYPNLLWHKDRKAKSIYLTFDDGPVPGPTEFVLEVLSAHQAKATFFCVGDNVRKHPLIFHRIINEGHTLGNHTFHHKNGWDCDTASYLQDVALGREAIVEHHPENRAEGFFRPPYGKIKRRQIMALKGETSIVMWDVLSGDFDVTLGPEQCLRKSVQATSNGSIVVFHDSVKSAKSLHFALPRYLDHFSALGYTFSGL